MIGTEATVQAHEFIGGCEIRSQVFCCDCRVLETGFFATAIKYIQMQH